MAHRSAALICVAVLSSTGREARAEEGKMNPALATGLGILGLSYLPSAIVGFTLAEHDQAGALSLAVPVVGPLIAMELLPVRPEARWLYVGASLVQTAGVATVIVGLLLPDDASMPEKLGGLRAYPVVTERGGGLALGRAF